MKSIMYVGATLMIGASIYGFVDYEKTKNQKGFTDMYKETEVTEPVIVPDRKMTSRVENKETAVKEKTKVAKKQLVKNDRSIKTKEEPAEMIKPVVDEEKMTGNDVKIENTAVTVVPSKVNVSDKIVKQKKRKLSTKLFSRGALDERYIKEEIKLDSPKKPGKVGKKEQ
jgi:hypothetical protein